MQNCGRWLPNDYFIVNDNNRGHRNTEEQRAAFRTALSEQIHSLTGQKPRLELQKRGEGEQWIIFYK